MAWKDPRGFGKDSKVRAMLWIVTHLFFTARESFITFHFHTIRTKILIQRGRREDSAGDQINSIGILYLTPSWILESVNIVYESYCSFDNDTWGNNNQTTLLSGTHIAFADRGWVFAIMTFITFTALETKIKLLLFFCGVSDRPGYAS